MHVYPFSSSFSFNSHACATDKSHCVMQCAKLSSILVHGRVGLSAYWQVVGGVKVLPVCPNCPYQSVNTIPIAMYYLFYVQNYYINQSINQSIFECIMPHGTRAQAGPKQHYTQTAHIFTKKTVGLDNVSFTYIVCNSVYNSVKGLQSIGSSVWHYMPKRAFHIVWITAAVLWLWQARHRILAVVSSSEMEE